MPTNEDFDPDAEPTTEVETGSFAAGPVGPAPSTGAAPGDDATAPLAGAWLPPSIVQRPLSRPAPYAGPVGADPIAGARAAPPPAVPPAPGPATVKPGEAALLADLPLDAPSDLPGWLVLVGGGIGSLAFLLPWAPLVFDFYWDSWGLTDPVRLLVFLVVLSTTALAVVPNRIGTWFRTGVLGILAGGIGVGLTLPRIVGQDDVPFGVLVEAVAAILLIVGGSVAVAPDRQGTRRPGG